MTTMRRAQMMVMAVVVGVVMASAVSALPTLAQGATAAPAAGAAGPQPPSPGGLGYWHAAYSHVHISGNALPGLPAGVPVAVPPCWLEPRFTGALSWHPGDPALPPGNSYDAETYWWWFAGQQEPGLLSLIAHDPAARKALTQEFKSGLASPASWWWVPAWLPGSAGFACAQGLISSLNNGYLGFEPPSASAGNGGPGAPLTGRMLAALARAQLELPGIAVQTNPPVRKPSDVNLPVWVSVRYLGPERPADMASVPVIGGGSLWARVFTSTPTVSVAVSGGPGQRTVYNTCPVTGSHYGTGDATTIPKCGVTFLAPGTYTITVTAHWNVFWQATDNPGQNPFGPGWPPSDASATVTVTAREIQAINNGG